MRPATFRIEGEPPIDMATLPPLSTGTLIRFGPVPKKCPYDYNTNDEATALYGGKKNHHWMEFEATFQRVPGLYPFRKPEGIPNWSWCNGCGYVDTERHMCEEHVYNGWGSSRCNRQGIMQSQKRDYKGDFVGPLIWFCKMHDAETKHQKRVAQNIIWRQQEAAADEQRRIDKADRDARNELVKAALEMKEWMEASGIHLDDEWAGQLYRRVTNAKDNLKG